jgi:hypothetical protein
MLRLAHGLAFADLYTTAGAAAIDRLFLAHLDAADAPLAARLREGRTAPDALGNRDEGDLLIALGPHVEDFVAALFGVQEEVRALEAAQNALAPLYAVKRQFVQRKAMGAYKADAAGAFDGPALRAALEARIGAPIVGRNHEIAFANAVSDWLKDEAAMRAIDLAMRYAAWAATAGRRIATACCSAGRARSTQRSSCRSCPSSAERSPRSRLRPATPASAPASR